MARRGLLGRHLVMPGGLDDTRKIIRFIVEEISPNTYVNVMEQYYPAGKVGAEQHSELNCHTTDEEMLGTLCLACESDLHRIGDRCQLRTAR